MPNESRHVTAKWRSYRYGRGEKTEQRARLPWLIGPYGSHAFQIKVGDVVGDGILQSSFNLLKYISTFHKNGG